ncbi:hypothetical protein FRC0129_00001 [Corynebacterium diphtheriae]|nr:hypothetical protein CIP107549_00001 [Corynebacterium diphtheriae]CAB0728216.1 hypothetical protein FRC0129_00001 [Corynebacterium diphtheriae]
MNTLTRGILSVHQTGVWIATPRGSKNKELSWAEKPHTINKVGSIFTIQDLDLNYAGVIIGPSVQYRDGEIIFVPKESHNPNVRAKRTLSDGSKKSFTEDLLRNQLNVLMTRGVHGVYIYAVDPALQAELLKASVSSCNN